MKKKIIAIIVTCPILATLAILISALVINNTKVSNEAESEEYKEHIEQARVEDYINISQCSEEFMDNYFQEARKLSKSDNKEDILIVTSKEQLEDTYGASYVIAGPNNQYFLQYTNSEEKNKALKALKENTSIIVEENQIREAEEYAVVSSSYNSWGVEAMGINEILSQIANMPSDRLNEIKVAVIDSGLDTSLFEQNFPGRMIEGYNVLEPDAEMVDNSGHGTHVAGTIAECTPNNVKIIPIRVIKEKRLYDTDAIIGINYATYNKQVDVMNMSFGGYAQNQSEFLAIESARTENNCISVAAAGNDNSSSEHYPAGFNNTLSISAVDSDLKKASFSNYGNTISFATPGVAITSINGTMSGTSMATPHAVAAVSLLKCIKKDLSLKDSIEILRSHSIDLGEEGLDPYYGYGFINFKNTKLSNKQDGEIFENNEVTVWPSEYKPDYNYGTTTNLMNISVKIFYGDNQYYTKKISELSDVEIIGYKPNDNSIQNIVIKHGNEEHSIVVDNRNLQSGWNYEIIDNKIKLTKFKYNNVPPLDVIIPEKISDLSVTSLGTAIFKDIGYINKVSLPKSLTEIGAEAFRNSKIHEVEAQADEIYLNDFSFAYMPNLIEVNSKIARLGENSFAGCDMLQKVEFSNKIDKISWNAFYRCYKLDLIDIPNSVTTIEEQAFLESGLKSVHIPGNVKSIGDSAFYGCENLTEIDISEGVEVIDNNAFGKTSLEQLRIPKSVKTINGNPFIEIDSLDRIEVYNDTYGKEYVIKKQMNYVAVDPVEIIVNTVKENYNTSEKVDIKSDISSVELHYATGVKTGNEYKQKTEEEILTDGYSILYQNNKDCFNYGDYYYKIKGINKYDIEFEQLVYVNVKKNDKTVLNPTIAVTDKAYDGKTIIPEEYIIVSNLDSSEYTIENAVSSSSNIGNQTATITLKLTDSKFQNSTFDNGKQEKTFTIDFKIIKADLNVKDSSKGVVVKYDRQPHSITLDLEYDDGIRLRFMDENNEYTLEQLPQYTEIGTYKIKYKLFLDNNHNEYLGERTLIINSTGKLELGDVNADGKINVIDCTAILRHIKGVKALSIDEATRADVNQDDKINVIDCTAILKHIKGTKLIS